MSHVLRIGVADQIAYFRAFNTDGSAKTDLTSATAGLALTVFRIGQSEVSISSLSDKGTDNATHSDGAIRQVAGNLYTVDLPDAATAVQTPSVGVRGSYTGGVIEPVPHPIVDYNPGLFNLIAQADINTGNTDYILVDAATGPFSSAGLFIDSMVEIYDDSEKTSAFRWVVDHVYSGSGSLMRIDFDKPLTFTPTSSDKIKVHKATRFTSNVRAWRDGLPNALVSGKVDAYDSNANTLLNDIPTVAEFNARTLPSADYFNASTDTVTVGTNNDKTGYTLAADQAVNVTKVGGTSVSGPNDLKADVSALATTTQLNDRTLPAASYFDPTTDTVTVGVNNDKTGYSLTQTFPANFHLLGINESGHVNRVVLVDTTSVNTDMRGTDNALLAASYTAAPSASTVAASVRTELSTELARVDTSISSRSSQTSVDTIDGIVDTILVDTNELQTNQGNWVTATGFSTHSAADVWGVTTRTITGGTITTNNDKTAYQLAADQAVNVTKIDGVEAIADGSYVNFPETIGTSTLSPAGLTAKLGEYGVSTSSEVSAVAAAVWAVGTRTITGGTINTNSDKSGYSLAADQAVNVTKVGGTSVSGPADLKADVSGIQTIVNKIDTMLVLDGAVYQFTANALELAPTGTGGGGDSAATIYTYFTDGTRANAFKADVSGLATTSNLEARTLLAADYFNPSTDTVTVSTASSSGIASSVRTELSTELGRIDASVSSRLASASYTAPANTDIAAILADTNELQTNQGNWVTATGFSTHSAADVWAVVARTITGGTITTNNDKTGYSLTQSFPANFASLGINSSGHISRVTLVDTTTTNTDMRGTNNALLASSYVAPANADISAIKTVTDKLNTALVLDGAVYQFTANALELAPVSSGGGDSAASIYAYFTDDTRANAFKADVSTIAEDVWNVSMLDVGGIGTTGGSLNAASSAGDPWSVYLPGSYVNGMAGNIISKTALESTSQSILSSIFGLSNNDVGEFF